MASGWLMLALVAMGISAVFALLLVVARTPFLNAGLLPPDFFTSALVLHVDFAVLVWFLSFAGVLWSLLGGERGYLLARAALLLSATGVGLMLIARFSGETQAVLSNYIPILKGPVFLSGLSLFGLGVMVMVLRSLLFGLRGIRVAAYGLKLGGWCAAMASMTAAVVLLWSYVALPVSAEGLNFEQLFWGAGHLLQFTHMLLMLVAWLVLARLAGIPLPGLRAQLVLFILALAPLLFTPLIHVLYTPDTDAFRDAYTGLMRFGSWPVAAFIAGVLLNGYLRRPKHVETDGFAEVVLLFSILLFTAGLISGALIREDNVLVTAHYHGTVGAVTLSFMGLTYHLLPRLGAALISPRAVRVQARLYGGGMLALILGLLLSGLQGVQRKTPGTGQLADNAQELIGMLLMGAGGLVGLLATVLFLVLAARALWPARQTLFQAGMDHSR